MRMRTLQQWNGFFMYPTDKHSQLHKYNYTSCNIPKKDVSNIFAIQGNKIDSIHCRIKYHQTCIYMTLWYS